MMKDTIYPLLLLYFLPFLAACNADATAVAEHNEKTIEEGSTFVTPPDSVTRLLFSRMLAQARLEEWEKTNTGALMQEVGLYFIGSPYVAGTLDENAEEALVLKLDGFDCVTFVENVFALAKTIQLANPTLEAYAGFVKQYRYMMGEIDGYCSRLHYFSGWMIDNHNRGNVLLMTPDLGGVPLQKTINFMSTHRSSYPLLVDNDSLVQEIARIEDQLNQLELHYIPQAEIRQRYADLRQGDIIALVTDIEGLDVAHTGLVYKGEEGNTGLLHASTSDGVIVSSDLQAYVEGNRRQIGIMVARPL